MYWSRENLRSCISTSVFSAGLRTWTRWPCVLSIMLCVSYTASSPISTLPSFSKEAAVMYMCFQRYGIRNDQIAFTLWYLILAGLIFRGRSDFAFAISVCLYIRPDPHLTDRFTSYNQLFTSGMALVAERTKWFWCHRCVLPSSHLRHVLKDSPVSAATLRRHLHFGSPQVPLYTGISSVYTEGGHIWE